MGRWTRRAILVGLGAAGLLYGCTTPASQFTADVEAKFPPIGQFVDVDGTQIHYDKRGSGPAVVLIHGASGNLRDFTFSISNALVAEGFTAIALDRPGHGYSELGTSGDHSPSAHAKILRGAVSALGVAKPIVLGHSYGGAVAAAWAVDAPESLSGVAIISGLTYPWPGGDNNYHAAAATTVLGAPLNALVRERTLKGAISDAIEYVYRPQQAPAGYAKYIGAELSVRPGSFRQNGRDISNVNDGLERISAQYSNLRVPIELVHGTADRIVPIDLHARRFKHANPTVTLTELPGIGHMAHQVAEKEVLEAIKRLARR